jgi:proteasome-associated ATPase
MPHPARNEPLPLDLLLGGADGDLSLEDKVAYVGMLRTTQPEQSESVDKFLLSNLGKFHEGLLQAREKLEEFGEMVEKLTAFPWHTATYVGSVPTPEGDRAIVLHGTTQRVVGLDDGIDIANLSAGDEVFLTNNLNLVMAKSPRGVRLGGETAYFSRKQPNGQLVVKWRDEEMIVDAAPALALTELAPGDLLRFDRNLWMAFEKVEPARGHQCLLESVPDIRSEQIGGLDKEIDTLFSALTIVLTDPARAARYGLGGRQSILMIGPPGCGKTLLAKAAANEVMRVSGRSCQIAVVKPAEFESPWVGETQSNIRNFFKRLQEAAGEGFVVAFFDEVESVGRTRGSAVGHHSDKFLAALLAELDGFAERKNIAIISATNRKELVDAALLERLSDIEISVKRPSLQGARSILGIHLPATLPFSPNGSAASATREELIETAVSRFYSPNADNEISVIRFRDGKQRTVLARELVSGRIFEQVCRQARRSACLRDLRGEAEPGLRVLDIDGAVTQAMQRMRTTLSVENAHSYLDDLPQDIAVTSVEPVIRKVKPTHYLSQ